MYWTAIGWSSPSSVASPRPQLRPARLAQEGEHRVTRQQHPDRERDDRHQQQSGRRLDYAPPNASLQRVPPVRGLTLNDFGEIRAASPRTVDHLRLVQVNVCHIGRVPTRSV
jgi:hypothetical protein